jgi:ubiquinone/menaquinone biosynthesis C-methylase UbiE
MHNSSSMNHEVSGCGAPHGFGPVAGFYETASRIFADGLIARAKRDQLDNFTPGARVLFLGVGAGNDAVAAAALPLQLTCLDISSGMLEQLRRSLNTAGLQAELLCEDACRHQRLGYYDFVVYNFFLNCFREPECIAMIQHAAEMLKPGGKSLITDVSPPRGNFLQRIFSRIYLGAAKLRFWLGGMIP